MRTDLLARVDGLRLRRTPFVLATVVRAERPTSAKPGDCAVVTADGTLDGFVGGTCAESTVRVESLRLLAVGESELLRITPDATAAPQQDGVRTIGNPCLSGGTLEIFLEAMIPPVLVGVFGESPVARALERVGAAMEWDMRPGLDPVTTDTSAVVVASHGRDELPVLRAALDQGVAYIALVASRKRAASRLRPDWTSALARRPRSHCRSARGSWPPGRGSRTSPLGGAGSRNWCGRRWRSTRSAVWRWPSARPRCTSATCTSAGLAAWRAGRGSLVLADQPTVKRTLGHPVAPLGMTPTRWSVWV
jgi:xanthine/CO dehydrogenase XdhC/CoxF family maturation factor